MGYRLFVRGEKGERYFGIPRYATNEQADKAREYIARNTGIRKEAFGIASFCDICEKETEIYEDGCCKHCFEKFVSSIRGGAKQ